MLSFESKSALTLGEATSELSSAIRSFELSRLSYGLLAFLVIVNGTFSQFVVLQIGALYLSVDRVGYILVTILLLGYMLKRNVRVVLHRPPALVILLLLFLLVQVVASVCGESPVKSMLNLARQVLSSYCLFAIVYLFRKRIKLHTLSRLLVTIAIFHFFYFFYEVAVGRKILYEWIDVAHATKYQLGALQLIGEERGHRFSLNFSNPLVLSQYSAVVIALSAFLIGRKAMSRTAFAFILPTYVLYGLLTKSRMFFLTTLFTGAFYAIRWLSGRRRTIDNLAKLIIFFAFLTVIFLAFIPEAVNYYQGNRGMSLVFDANRVVQIVRALRLLVARPLLGYGIGNAATVLGFGINENGLGTVDNYYLTVALESGFVGLCAFLAIAAWFIVAFIKAERSRRPLFFVLLVVFINLMTLSVVELHPLLYMLFALPLSIGWGSDKAKEASLRRF